MPSQPGETPQEDIRNAMAILSNVHTCIVGNEGTMAYELSVADRRAVMHRLAAALAKLELINQVRCPRCRGADMQPAPNQVGRREQCPACGWSRPVR